MNLASAGPDNKLLVLGTALWGWGVDRAAAYALLDEFVAQGGQLVDTAINYPINKRACDFGLAGRWIADWLDSRGGGIKVLVKIGAIDNMGSSGCDLTPTAMQRAAGAQQNLYGDALAILAVHWDNRGSEPGDAQAMSETVAEMKALDRQGLMIGFSGVSYPALYRQLAPELASRWWIQVKENAQTHKARLAYAEHFPNAKYLAYGINMGGLKHAPAEKSSSMALRGISRPTDLAERLNAFLRSDHSIAPRPKSFNDLALLSSYSNPHLSGVIIGPRTPDQLKDSFGYWNAIQESLPTEACSAVHRQMRSLSA